MNKETTGNEKSGIVIPVTNTVLLPGIETEFWLGEHHNARPSYPETGAEVGIALPLKQNTVRREVQLEDFYTSGVSYVVKNVKKTKKGICLEVSIKDRIEIKALRFEDDRIRAEYVMNPETSDVDEKSREKMLGYMKKIVHDIGRRFKGGEEYVKAIDEINDINSFIASLCRFMSLSHEELYELLEIDSVKNRSLHFMDIILKQKANIELNLQLSEKISENANKFYRKQVLREQLKAIQEELGEGKDADASNKNDYQARIEEAHLPEAINKAALEELDKLQSQGRESMDGSIIRTYLDFLLALPWKKTGEIPVDLEKARMILNDQHYGLEKTKERIVQHLAVMELRKETKGSIILLVGPPGTGKTSLGKSVAEALGRKYVRLSLGGIHDEADIRGHRRTYVGALPGRILKGMKTAGVTNPVMVLDEVDKLMAGGFSGDPASALLEVLDPEQNNSFTDHYLDLPYDLSDVFFIATANTTETIPRPLLDRMEVIQFSGYTEDEKFHIGKNHLVPTVLREGGLTADQLVIGDETLRKIIGDYTLEAGVRGFQKQLATIARVVSEKIVSRKAAFPYIVKDEELEGMLGRKVSDHAKAQKENPCGVVTGLAWTPVGGEILFVEATDMPGAGEITLTGMLGDVMKESARISLSLLKSRMPLAVMNFKERDVHVHVPAGAVSKDGPSAGIAIFSALTSLFTGIKVNPRLAMTGEITLRGAVLPIGGLKEKLLSAKRAGITKVLIPKDNVVDLKELPDEVKAALEIVPVETVEEVLWETVHVLLPRIEHVFTQENKDARPFAAARN
jgi:ATP-dependent Lon protease